MILLTNNVKMLAGELVNRKTRLTSLELLGHLLHRFEKIFAEEIALGESVVLEF